METKLILLALAPVAILLAYIWLRDKYEHEPWRMLLGALALGAFSVFPVFIVERALGQVSFYLEGMLQVFWNSFVVAATTEESFKFLFLMLLIWRSPKFNEKFDGIVYAVFVSLGFAAIENISYVLRFGASVGIIRAFTAVPAHFVFGVTMGFFTGMAKFYISRRKQLLRAALLYPLVLHGVYDFILMSQHPWGLLLFVPFLIFMWRYGLKKMKQLNENSIYKTNFKTQEDILKKGIEQ